MSEQALSSSQAEDNVFELVDVIDPAEIYELTPDLKVNASKEDADLLDGLSDELSNYSAPTNNKSDDENNLESLENLSDSLGDENSDSEKLKNDLDSLIDELDDGNNSASHNDDFDHATSEYSEENSSNKSNILDDLEDSIEHDNLAEQVADPFAGLDGLGDLDDLDDLGNFAKELGIDDDSNSVSDDDDSSLDDLTAAIAKKREEFNSALEEESTQSSGKLIESLDDLDDFDSLDTNSESNDDTQNSQVGRGDDLADLLASLDNASQSDLVSFSTPQESTDNTDSFDSFDSLDDILDLSNDSVVSSENSETDDTQNSADNAENIEVDYITYNPDADNTDVPEDISLDDLEKLTQSADESDIKKTSAQDLLSELDSLFESEVENLELLEQETSDTSPDHTELVESITSIDDLDLDIPQEEQTKISLEADPVPVFTADLDITNEENIEENISASDFDSLDTLDFEASKNEFEAQMSKLPDLSIQESDFLDDLDVDFEAQLDATLGGAPTQNQSNTTENNDELELGQGAIDLAAIDPSTLDSEALDTELFDLQNDFETRIIDDSEDVIDYNAIPDENPNSFEAFENDTLSDTKQEDKKSFGLGSLSDIIGLIQPITKAASDIMQASQASISNQSSVQNANNDNTNTQAQFNLLFSEFRLLSAEINDLKRKQEEGKSSIENDSLAFPTMLSAEPSYQEIEENITKLRAKLHNLEESITDSRGDFQLLASEVVAQAEGAERITAEEFINEMTDRFAKHALQIVNFENSLSELENANLQMDTLMTQVRTKVEKNTAKIELLASRLDNIERSLENMDSIVASAAARIIREEIIALLADDMPEETTRTTEIQTTSIVSSIENLSSDEDITDFSDEDIEEYTPDVDLSSIEENTDDESLNMDFEDNQVSDSENFGSDIAQSSNSDFAQAQDETSTNSFSLNLEDYEQEEAESSNASANLNVNQNNEMSYEESQLVLDLPQDVIEEMQDNIIEEAQEDVSSTNFNADELDPFDAIQASENNETSIDVDTIDPFDSIQEANSSSALDVANLDDDLFDTLSAEQENTASTEDLVDSNMLDIDEILNIDSELETDSVEVTQENMIDIDDILNQNMTESAVNSDVNTQKIPSISDKESLLNGILYNLKDYKE